MVQRIHHTLEDDLDGGKADETVQFGIDGTSYEIDLSKKNAKALRDSLNKYAAAGRKATTGRRGGRAGQPRRAASGGRDTAAIRAWAAGNGYEISTRGRIPTAVVEAFDAAGT